MFTKIITKNSNVWILGLILFFTLSFGLIPNKSQAVQTGVAGSAITSTPNSDDVCEVRKNGSVLCRNSMVAGFDFTGSSGDTMVTVYFQKNNHRFLGYLSSNYTQANAPGMLLSGLVWAYEAKLPVDVVIERSGNEHSMALAGTISAATKVKFINDESSYISLPEVMIERANGDSR